MGSRHRSTLGGWGTLVVWLATLPSSAQGFGPEIEVNTTTVLNQSEPDVAVVPGGDFIVAWSDDNGGLPYYGMGSVRGQRLSPSGSFLGTELDIADASCSWPFGAGVDTPHVEADANGSFVVSWRARTAPTGAEVERTSTTPLHR